eukprot:SAG31_NODE_12166_length_962_cov_1.241020_1_plen_192_part_10
MVGAEPLVLTSSKASDRAGWFGADSPEASVANLTVGLLADANDQSTTRCQIPLFPRMTVWQLYLRAARHVRVPPQCVVLAFEDSPTTFIRRDSVAAASRFVSEVGVDAETVLRLSIMPGAKEEEGRLGLPEGATDHDREVAVFRRQRLPRLANKPFTTDAECTAAELEWEPRVEAACRAAPPGAALRVVGAG